MDRSAPPSTEAHVDRRPALDGLRGIAVLLVLAFHLKVPRMWGGFVGVDLFFVLSGYLITSLLFAEAARDGRIALGAFWARRGRRLLPAFLVVAVVVGAYGVARAPGFLREKLAADIVASLAYVANWRFIASSSYFASDGTVSPLQHVWSLAIEEQFYIAWPLVVAASFAVTRARRSSLVRAVALVTTVWIVGSAALMAVIYSPLHPERAYMGTDTRTFEPLVGALLACAFQSERARGWCARWRHVLVVAGAAGIAFGVALLGRRSDIRQAYFFGGAVGFSVACAALIAGIESGRSVYQRVLGWWPIAKLGVISYAVYLWHWPLSVWILRSPTFDPGRAATVLAITIGASIVSYFVIESPVRSGVGRRWLTNRRLAWITPSVLVVLAAATTGLLRAPPKDGFTILIIGDSVPKNLVPFLSEEAEKRGWHVYDAAEGACPTLPAAVTTRAGETFANSDRCIATVPKVQAEAIEKYRPDLVVWWSRYDATHRRQPSGRLLVADTPEFWEAEVADVRAAIDRLTVGGARVLFAEQDRPGRGMLGRCSPKNCHWFLAQLLERHDLAERWNALMREIARVDRRVSVTSIDDAFCRDHAVPCDDSLDAGGFARPDGSHFSDAAGPIVARALLDRIEPR